jgi:NIPSNAP
MSDGTHAYLHVKIQLVRGKTKIFTAAMSEMAPVLESYGWQLIGAFTPVIGRLNAVYHVWRVPSADGVLSALDRVRAHPDALRWHDAFAESIADEALELVRPTSYSRSP